MRRTIVAAAAVLALAACSGDPTSGTPASPTGATVSAAPALDVAGTWMSDAPSETAVGDALGDEFSGWTADLSSEIGSPLTLTLDGGDYTIENGSGDVLREGTYEVDGEQLKLQVDPNGVTVLDAAIDGDEMTLSFVSNSTQDYPPDVAPEEAIQRALFTAVPFVRA